jgi:hypothetical protein
MEKTLNCVGELMGIPEEMFEEFKDALKELIGAFGGGIFGGDFELDFGTGEEVGGEGENADTPEPLVA